MGFVNARSRPDRVEPRYAITCASVHSSQKITGMVGIFSLRAAFTRSSPSTTSIVSPRWRARMGIGFQASLDPDEFTARAVTRMRAYPNGHNALRAPPACLRLAHEVRLCRIDTDFPLYIIKAVLILRRRVRLALLGNHYISAPTPATCFVDSSTCCPLARIRHVPRVLADRAFSPVGRAVTWGCDLNPRVDAQPHVFTYELSGFSG